MPEIIKARNLTKVYDVPKKEDDAGFLRKVMSFLRPDYEMKTACDNITFSVNEGEIVGILGKNGAGKSTAIKMMTGILTPTSGEITVLGYIPSRDRYEYTQNIGVVFGNRQLLWWDIPVIDSFMLYKDIYEISDSDYKERLEFITKTLDIKDLLKMPVRKLSFGQRMKCELAASLLNRPKILFLDEPTIGMDTLIKEKVRGFIKHVNTAENTTVILTTHDMSDVEELCDRVILIDEGKVIYDGTIPVLKKLFIDSKTVELEYRKITDEARYKKVLLQVEIIEKNLTFVRMKVKEDKIPSIVKCLFSCVEVVDIKIHEPKLETVIKKIYSGGFNGVSR